jgi:hypothetical protein
MPFEWHRAIDGTQAPSGSVELFWLDEIVGLIFAVAWPQVARRRQESKKRLTADLSLVGSG